MRGQSILIVDDDEDVRDTLREYFELSGFVVYACGDGAGMRGLLKNRKVDLVLMDLNLPGEDGLVLTRELRASQSMPIIMLTAAGQTIDRIIGLEMGADDYVAKPFEPRELLARVRSVLRRAGERTAPVQAAAVPQQSPMVRMGGCTLDLAAHQLYGADGQKIPLTALEFDLLKTFAENPDRVLTRTRLLELAHRDDADVFDRSIDIRISRIRKKIEVDAATPQTIQTVRGVGYIFVSGAKSGRG